MTTTRGRNPNVFPASENYACFSDRELPKHEESCTLPKQADDPWSRLYSTPTLSSSRRDITYFDPQVPQNSLDFVLKCKYDHHSEFMKSKATVLQQPETTGDDHGRVLKNRPQIQPPVLLEEQPLIHHEDKKKSNVNSSKGLSIESHHSEATNQGYSRKHDGGFYSC